MAEQDYEYMRNLIQRQEEFFLRRHQASLELLAAGITHEMNNLFAGMTGYAQMAMESPEDAQLGKKALEICLRAARRGGEIISRLGHFSHFDRPRWEVSDPGPVVRDVADLVRGEAVHDGILVDMEISDVAPVRFDPSLLGTALLELLRNAIAAVRESPLENRLIRIGVWEEGDDVVISVRDSGPGMSEEELEQAGDPFFTTRGPLAMGPIKEAKGLGLAVARGIVQTLDGAFDLHSRAGEGTEVRLRLPQARLGGEADADRVLIVDDEVTSRRILSALLTKAGLQAEVVENARDALHRMLEQSFAAVILDQVMPEMSGTQLLERMQVLRKEHVLPPVIMVTAQYEPELARRALELGAVACTAKPINRDKIAYLIQAHVGTAFPLAHRHAAPKTPPPDDTRILVVEPDGLVRDIFLMLLERQGYDVTGVQGGRPAILATEGEYFNLILIDVLLHDQPGVEVIRQLRLNNPYTPILATTTRISRESLQAALRAGATRAMRKPLEVQAVLDEVADLLQIFREGNRQHNG